MKIWLDDERPTPDSWKCAKTAQEALKLLDSGEEVTHISFDHDLGEGNGDGYDVVCEIERRVYEGLMTVPEMTVHSDNPPGAAKIMLAIEAIYRRNN